MVDADLDNKNKDDDSYFLSCDWGTSSFRLHLAKRKTGAIVSGISNSQGTKKTYDLWLETQNTMDRIAYYQLSLKEQIEKFNEKIDYNIDHIPLVISGMASSSIGMKELPYSDLPFNLDQPNIYADTINATPQFPHDIYLISGLRSKSDVMRGEETELIGLFESTGITKGLYILAGTHSKHAFVKNSRVTDFNTYMTGELFDLLISKSILSGSIPEKSPKNPGPSFKEGISTSLDENILHTLFSIRAGDVLNQSNIIDNYDYLSGLLIGTELQDIRQKSPGKIVLAGNKSLRKYYAEALDFLKLSYTEVNSSNSYNSTSLGHSIILNQLN